MEHGKTYRAVSGSARKRDGAGPQGMLSFLSHEATLDSMEHSGLVRKVAGSTRGFCKVMPMPKSVKAHDY